MHYQLKNGKTAVSMHGESLYFSLILNPHDSDFNLLVI